MSATILPSSRWVVWGAMLLGIAAHGVHFLWFHGGYFGYDDIEYCRLAASLAAGEFEHTSLYAHRYAVVLPLAASYGLLGVGDLGNFAFGLASLLAILYLAMGFVKDLPIYQQWLVALFLIFAPMHLMYVEKPMPDILVELGVLMSIVGYVACRFDNGATRAASFWFVIGIMLLFLAKETFLVFYPYFVGLMLLDVARKERLRFWKGVVAALALFVWVYVGYSAYFLGDPLARIHSVFAGQYVSACSYDLLPVSAVLDRIGYQLWAELARNLYLVPLCFVPILLKSSDEKHRFVAGSYGVLLLLANFMTISYTDYVPLCPDARHHAYLLPVGAWVMAYGVGYLHGVSRGMLGITLGIAGGLLFVSVHYHFEHSWWLYLPVIAAIVLGYAGHRWAMVFLLALGCLGVFVKNSIYNQTINYADQKRLNDHVIHQVGGNKYVFTDAVNVQYGDFHSQFRSTQVQFLDYKTLDTLALDAGTPQYLIINGMTSYLSGTSWEGLPEFVRTAHERSAKVYENPSGVVYRIK